MNALGKCSIALGCLICCFALLTASVAQVGPQMPKTEGESLAGQRVVLPDAAAGKVAVLVFGFTKASKAATSAWAAKLQADFGARSEFELYQLPVLEDVPRFVRGMAMSSMKKGVAEDKRDHFVPILHGEAELKELVHYKQADDAYLVVLGRTGNVIQQTHGTGDDATYAAVQSAIESALRQK
jgi:hypothetical protein